MPRPVARRSARPLASGLPHGQVMARTRFRPGDPSAVHQRFERVKARAVQRMEEEFRLIKRAGKIEKPVLRRTAPRSNRPA